MSLGDKILLGIFIASVAAICIGIILKVLIAGGVLG